MSTKTFISAGSTTLINNGPGNLYGVHANNVAGAVVYAWDAVNAPSATPDFNSVASPSIIERIGPTQNAGNLSVNLHGVHFNSGLTVSATSSAPVSVYWSV